MGDGMKKGIFIIILLTFSTIGFAETTIREVHKFIVDFIGQDAERLTRALGLRESIKSEDEYVVREIFRLEASINGSASSGGYPIYRYAGRATLDASYLKKVDNRLVMTLEFVAARDLYEKLVGISPVGVDGKKTLELDRFHLICRMTIDSFSPYECIISIDI